MKPRKIPMRMCVGCREMKPKRELLRVVRSPEGEVSFDLTGRNPGRGAYVCPNADCLRTGLRRSAREPDSADRAPAQTEPGECRWKRVKRHCAE